jgi:hypothetical protein
LEPVCLGDADVLADRAKLGEDVEVTIKKRRSLPQLRRYWKMLHDVVEATDDYPSAEHLHTAIKYRLNYTVPFKTFSHEMYFLPDSAAFSKMTAAEFRVFFDRAVKLLAEQYGIDPLAIGDE